MIQDTIAAIATALGEASISVIRVSGDGARDLASKLFRLPSGKVCSLALKREIYYGMLIDPHTEEAIDEAVLLWMPGPKSYTAEDIIELQVHGGVRICNRVLEAALAAGARLAEPGEFTKRAFLNGRLDLSQAEAVIDLIRSKTDLASKSALGQVKGHLSETIRRLRKQLIHLQAHVEVTIDYPEHDVESVVCAAVIETGSSIREEVQKLHSSAKYGEILREGIRTAIIGQPNVGKSSLLNALLRRERAIVTDIPGTTRDVIEEYINVRGIPFRIVDTAGIRETSDIVEQIGVERSREAAQDAELVLVVLDSSRQMTEDDERILASVDTRNVIVVLNKADLPRKTNDQDVANRIGDVRVVEVSAKQLNGLSMLEEAMEQKVTGGSAQLVEATYMTNARQGRLLLDALNDLELAIEAARMGATLDIIAVQLQAAYASLGMVIGEEVGEDLLDEIFSQFCLGK